MFSLCLIECLCWRNVNDMPLTLSVSFYGAHQTRANTGSFSCPSLTPSYFGFYLTPVTSCQNVTPEVTLIACLPRWL